MSALQEAQVAFKFAGGIETKMDSKAVPAVRLLGLENGVFKRAISISKRNGYDLLAKTIDGSTSVISGAKRLGTRDTELLLFTNTRCYSKQSGNDQWTDVGACIPATGYDRPVVHTGTEQTMPDQATAGGVTVYAWEDSLGGVWWTVVDASTGAVYRAPTQADANGQRPRCVAVGDVLHIYYAIPTQRRIDVLVVNPTIPTADVTAQILVEDLDSTNPVYDAVPTDRTGSPALIAWHEHATTDIRVGYALAGGVLGSPVSGQPSVYRAAMAMTADSPLACSYLSDSGGNEFALACSSAGSLRVSFYASTGVDETDAIAFLSTEYIVGVTLIKRIAMEYAQDTSRVLWVAAEEDATETSNHYTVVNWCKSSVAAPPSFATAFAGTVGTYQTLRSVGLASRAFQAGDTADIFAVFVHDTTFFNTYVTFRLSDFAPAGRHLPAAAYGLPARTHLSSVYVADDIATVSLPYKARLESANNDKFGEAAIRRIVMNFADDDDHQTGQIGRGLYLAAACPQHYDGYRWTEQSFHVGPEHITDVKAGGGSLTPSSTYEYVVWYEWTDSQGEIHRGPTSPGYTVTLGGGDSKVTLTLPTLRVTRKSNVRICVARSLAGDATQIFRVSSLDPTTAGANNGYVANDATVDTVSFVDTMSDATARLQEPVYTTGGILSNDPASLGSAVAVGKNRLFFIDASDGNVVRFSQRVATGYALEIAPELKHAIDPLGGDITAIAVMDDVVYVFKQSAIFAFNGDGPLENGSTAVSGYSASQVITLDVGCTDPSSIVLAPEGLMFKSAKGIYIVKRSREVAYVGSPAEAYNTQTVRRATVMPDRSAVLFLTDSGKSLYYDYLFDQWSTFTNHEGYDAAVVDGSYYYLRTNDIVFKETIDEHTDGGARITLRFETAWLHMGEHLQGFQRFWKLLLLGTWVSPHQLGIQYRLSYDEAWSDPAWLDATGGTDETGWLTGDGCMTIGQDPLLGSDYGDGVYGDGPYGGSGPDVYQWRFGIHEKGQAIQFRFEDFEKAGLAGASFELTEMSIVGGVIKPDMRPFSGARST